MKGFAKKNTLEQINVSNNGNISIQSSRGSHASALCDCVPCLCGMALAQAAASLGRLREVQPQDVRVPLARLPRLVRGGLCRRAHTA